MRPEELENIDLTKGMPQAALEALNNVVSPETDYAQEKKEILSILKSWEANYNESTSSNQ